MLRSTGEDGKTLLSLAARSGSKGAFEAVLAALSLEEVRYVNLSRVKPSSNSNSTSVEYACIPESFPVSCKKTQDDSVCPTPGIIAIGTLHGNRYWFDFPEAVYWRLGPFRTCNASQLAEQALDSEFV